MRKIYLLFLIFLSFHAWGQDDLLDMLEDEESTDTLVHYTYATFKTTRIVMAHTVDMQSSGELQFLISHRFGALSSGADDLWGLDVADIRYGFEYGINENWAIGMGRSSEGKMYDFYNKIKLLRQSTGAKNMPVTLSLVSTAAIQTLKRNDPNDVFEFKHDLTYTHQLLLARKFSSNISMQLMPTYLHRNLVSTSNDNNDIFALGAGGRFKFTPRFGVIIEYFYIMDDPLKKNFFEPLGVAFEIETGGHVFHLSLSNSTGMTDALALTQTTDSWSDGGIHLGFNISRVFDFRSSDKKHGSKHK